MAKSIEETRILPAKESSSKPSIELHDIDLHKNDPQGLSERNSEAAYQLFLKRGASHGIEWVLSKAQIVFRSSCFPLLKTNTFYSFAPTSVTN